MLAKSWGSGGNRGYYASKIIQKAWGSQWNMETMLINNVRPNPELKRQ